MINCSRPKLTQITVYHTVISASHLPTRDRAGCPDPFAIVTIGSNQQRTQTQKDTIRPTWNEQLVFEVAKGSACPYFITIEVYDKDPIAAIPLIGTLVLPVNYFTGKTSRRMVKAPLAFGARSKSKSPGIITLEVWTQNITGFTDTLRNRFRSFCAARGFNFALAPDPSTAGSLDLSRLSGISEMANDDEDLLDAQEREVIAHKVESKAELLAEQDLNESLDVTHETDASEFTQESQCFVVLTSCY